MQAKHKKLFIIFTVTGWLLGTVTGFAVLGRYGKTPGDQGSPVERWPAASSLPLAPQKQTLVIFLHEYCACSVASLHELAKLVTPRLQQIQPVIVFTRPVAPAHDLTGKRLRNAARRIRGALVVEDPVGTEARLFGAKTSGHVLLFDRAGARLFTGGITGNRGQEGFNPGFAAVLEAATVNAAAVATPIYGCSLFGRTLAALTPW